VVLSSHLIILVFKKEKIGLKGVKNLGFNVVMIREDKK
jgi:hypothetical protein